jgi:hypothetical protein
MVVFPAGGAGQLLAQVESVRPFSNTALPGSVQTHLPPFVSNGFRRVCSCETLCPKLVQVDYFGADAVFTFLNL